MVCEELDQLEWDFIQARAGRLDIDSLGWTNREFSCLDAILDHKREGIRANAAPVIKYAEWLREEVWDEHGPASLYSAPWQNDWIQPTKGRMIKRHG